MKSVIAWFVRNRIVAELITAVVFIGGLLAAPQLQREVIPTPRLQRVQLAVALPGAAPADVEQHILLPLENALAEVEGVDRTVAIATQGLGLVIVELSVRTALAPLLDVIERRALAAPLPADAQRPVISELLLEQPAINLTLYGDADERSLKTLGQRVLDDILALPEVTRAALDKVRQEQITIELSSAALAQYGLSFETVARIIRDSAAQPLADALHTGSSEVLLRGHPRAETGGDFARMELLRQPDGTLLQLRDVATVTDGFVESGRSIRFNDQPAVTVQVYRVGQQDVIELTDAVKAYVAQLEPQLPQGVRIAVWRDLSQLFHARIDTLISNGLQGLVLVFLVLILFMRPAIAFWVTHGVLLSFVGTLGVMYLLGLSLNMMSLFGFILVLGTLVDDGIVVGEAIYQESQNGIRRGAAAVAGAAAVCWPVVVSVFTNVQSFIPILYLPGLQAQIWAYVPAVVIIAYLLSLLESLFCLPAHLSRLEPLQPQQLQRNPLFRLQRRVASSLEYLAQRGYQPMLLKVLEYRWITLAGFVGMMLITIGLLAGGKVRMVFFPLVVSDSIAVDITLDPGVSAAEAEHVVKRVEQVLRTLAVWADARRGADREPTVRHVLRSMGQASDALGMVTQQGANVAQLFVELAPSQQRHIGTEELVERWRIGVQGIPHMRDVRFSYSLNQPGADIEVSLTSRDGVALAAVSEELQKALARYPGVYEIGDSERAPRDQIQFSLRPEAEAIGLSEADLARQLRQSRFGEEVQRVQRGVEEVSVVLRHDRASHAAAASLEQLPIRTRDGAELPLASVAQLQAQRVAVTLTRIDGMRTVQVSAHVNHGENDAPRIVQGLREEVLPALAQRYPGVRMTFSGSQREEAEVTAALFGAVLIATALVFATLVLLFRSYVQAMLVFAVLPFAVVGAIFAHIIFGITLSMLSLAGIVAALGVCVNDSVVLIDTINAASRQGVSRDEAIRRAGMLRFRPVLLTTVTTFVGLSTLMLDSSVQAQVLIPMATSLAWAVLVTTVVALLLIPVLVSLVWTDPAAPDAEPGA